MLLFRYCNFSPVGLKRDVFCPTNCPIIYVITQAPTIRDVPFGRHADTILLAADIDERRFTYNKDVLWILTRLSQHGRILKLRLGFCGRRTVRMSTRDGDFLNALKGVKTDELIIGDPKPEISSSWGVSLSQSMSFYQSRLPPFQKLCTVIANSGASYRTGFTAKPIDSFGICSKV